MEDNALDLAVVAAVFDQAGLIGWADVNVAQAARDAGLPLDRVRARFPGRDAVLLRFGALADQAALVGTGTEPSPRERLFEMIMLRFDMLQRHRQGVLSLMAALPREPGTALLLAAANARSMAWLLEAADLSTRGLLGALRVQGMQALWLYAARAWGKDESEDLASTMAAVDRGLDRAVRAEEMWPGRAAPAEAPIPELPPIVDESVPPPMDV